MISLGISPIQLSSPVSSVILKQPAPKNNEKQKTSNKTAREMISEQVTSVKATHYVCQYSTPLSTQGHIFYWVNKNMQD